MPNHLEFVTRPFESPRIRPGTPTQMFENPKVVTHEPITWGNGGSDVFDLRAHTQQELPQPKFEENQRTYDEIKVMNPDDHDQHVTVEAMTEYQARNQISKDRITLRFPTNTNTEDTEVISRNNIRKRT